MKSNNKYQKRARKFNYKLDKINEGHKQKALIFNQLQKESLEGYIIANSIKEINIILTELDSYKGVLLNGESHIAVKKSFEQGEHILTFPAFICNKQAEEKIHRAYHILLGAK